MARFTDELFETSFNQTGASRGSLRDDSAATTIGTIGDTLNSGVRIADEFIQNQIRGEVEDASDRLDQEFGVTDLSLFETDINNPSQPTPEGLQRSSENLRDLKRAFNAGSLTEANYFQRLDSITRQLRVQYPGFRKQIDSIVSEVASNPTANQVRRAFFSQLSTSSNNALQEQREITRFIRNNSQHLRGGIAEQFNNGTYTGSQEDLVRAIQRGKHEAEVRGSEIENIRLLKAERDLASEELLRIAEPILRDEQNAIITRLYFDEWDSLGGQSVNTLIADGVTEEEAGQLIQFWQEFRVEQAQEYRKFLNGEPFEDLTSDDIDKVIKRFDDELGVFEQTLTNGYFGLLNTLANTAKRSREAADIRVLNNRVLSNVSALQRALGASASVVLGNERIMSNFVDEVEGVLTQSITLNTISPNGQGLTETLVQARNEGDSNPRAVQQSLESFQEVLSNPEMPDTLVVSTVNSIFGPEETNLLEQFETVDDKQTVFEMLTSTSVSERLNSLRGTPEGKKAWDQYVSWVLNQAIPLTKTDFDTLGQVNQFTDADQMVFDPNTFHFRLDVGPDATFPGDPTGIAENINQDFNNIGRSGFVGGLTQLDELPLVGEFFQGGTIAAVRNVNRYMDILIPIARQHFQNNPNASQENLDQQVFTFLSNFVGAQGFQAPGDVERQGGFLSRLFKVAADSFNEGVEQLSAIPERIGSRVELTASIAEGDVGQEFERLIDLGTDVPEDFSVNVTQQQRGLLNLVASAEAPRGYQSANGNIVIDGLTELRLEDIIRLGRNRSQDSTLDVSSALGRYQFLTKTITDLMKLHPEEFNENSLFDESTQDRMSLRLMEDAGLKKYLDGSLSVEQFGNKLANIWAGLPLLSGSNRGSSVHAGVGNNKATITPEQFETMLQKILEEGST